MTKFERKKKKKSYPLTILSYGINNLTRPKAKKRKTKAKANKDMSQKYNESRVIFSYKT